MSDLRNLYQEMIIDHGRAPRNFGVLDTATHSQEGHNPLCGDQITIYIEEQDSVLRALRFKGKGCALCIASASLMTEMLEGKTLAQAQELFDQFHLLVTDKNSSSEEEARLGKLLAFKNISEFPVRVKCATLAWHTLKAALAERKIDLVHFTQAAVQHIKNLIAKNKSLGFRVSVKKT